MILSNEFDVHRLILVVDDQEINRDILGEILHDNYQLIYAANGAEALDIIHEHREWLSLILLDLFMPEMDGFQVMEEINTDKELSRIPIMVLTSEKSAELRALELGAVDFITKPFDMAEVIQARVKRVIELNEDRQLIQAAERDELTGLYNTGFFFEYAEQLIYYNSDKHMDAIVVNIEKFHLINELKGRTFGDEVLRKLGREIHNFLNTTKGIGCRVEGDLFYIYCEHMKNHADLLRCLQGCVDELSSHIHIQLRMGVNYNTDNDNPHIQFDHAKTACNIVRGNYIDHLMIYDDSIRQKEIFTERLINDVTRAVKEQQFEVYFQPKYDIQCIPPKLKSAEALVRWNHPDFGIIAPAEFVPMFEQNGLIRTVDKYVLEETAFQIAEWREKFGYTIPISVNLSRVDIFDSELEDNLMRLTKKYKLKTTDLMLEVTESAYVEDSAQLITVINKLRSNGFLIEMDDFGSGYSSLNMISSLPIDVLKMDMSFIKNIKAGNKDFKLVELILDIARYLDVPVVAEGVETEEQVRLLHDAGCNYVQGFYFSRALPPKQFEREVINKE